MSKLIHKFNKQTGFVLISTIVIIVLLLMLGTYYLSFSLSEYRIAKSQTVGMQDYYLAEAGVHEMIWRLKNDETWRSNFETNPSWYAEFTRDNDLVAGGSYTASIQNSDLAQGEVISTGTMIVQGQTSQRVIKTNIYKAIGENPLVDVGIYDNGVVDFIDSVVNIYLGGLFSNDTVLIKGSSAVYVAKKVQTPGNIIISDFATLTADEGFFAQNYPPAPDPVTQPAIDFDSDDPTSYKNQAIALGQLYTESDFADFLEANPSATLQGVCYVTGRVGIKRGMNITINGVLAADGSIAIGTKSNPDAIDAKVNVNHIVGEPSGILSKHKIDFGPYTRELDVDGLLYSLEEIRMVSIPDRFDIIGGFYSRKLQTISLWNELNITYDAEIINTTLGAPTFSPTIYVDHWEEEY